MANKAVIVDTSGLIGSKLMGLFLYQQGSDDVLIRARKEVRLQRPKLKESVFDFKKLEKYTKSIPASALSFTIDPLLISDLENHRDILVTFADTMFKKLIKIQEGEYISLLLK